MSNWALVVGIDKYAERRFCLSGAVRDALEMAKWLTREADPVVEPNHLYLLLSRDDESPPPPDGLHHDDATLANIVRDVRDLATKAAKPDDRLYVHFACHGMRATGLLGGDAILPADFQSNVPILSLQTQSILDYFKISRFRHQFFFIDACRNVPFQGQFNAGRFPDEPGVAQMRPDVEQFVFAATSRGFRAHEDRSRENDERGVFTEALLRGLRGEGEAKRYNLLKRRYEVKPEDLLNFVVREVRDRLGMLELAGSEELFQAPTLRGERSSSPVLAAFAEQDVEPLNLTIGVSPHEALGAAKLRILGAGVGAAEGPPLQEPHVTKLKPREYLLEAESPGFRAEPMAVRLVRDAAVELAFHGAPPHRAARRPQAGPPPAPAVPGIRREEEASERAPGGELLVRTWDPLSVLEVLDASGNRVASGAGMIRLKGIDAGMYTARLRSPSEGAVDQPVFVRPGRSAELEILPPAIRPSPALRATCAAAGVEETGVNTLRVSESLGAPQVAAPAITTLLAMALAVDPSVPGGRLPWRLVQLRQSFLPPLPQIEQGIQVILADEAADPDDSIFVGALEISELDGGERGEALAPLKPWAYCLALEPSSTPFPRIAAAAVEKTPGYYAVSGWFGGILARIAIPVLRGRATNLVIHRDGRGEVAAYVFMPPAMASGGDILLQRRLELAQRYLQAGEVDAVLAVLTPRPATQSETEGNQMELRILADRRDPVAEMLAGYAALRHAELHRGSQTAVAWGVVEAAASALTDRFPELSDGYVLQAALSESRDDGPSAAEASQHALDAGLPLFAPGLRRLGRLVSAHAMDHPRVEKLTAAVAGLPGDMLLGAWSAEEAIHHEDLHQMPPADKLTGLQ